MVSLSIHLLIDILVTHKLAIMNKVARNTRVQVFMWACFELLWVNTKERSAHPPTPFLITEQFSLCNGRQHIQAGFH